MASTTTNIGLTKPAGTDQALISAINGNMDIIDTKMGAVGNTSVQSQITSLSDQIATAPVTFTSYADVKSGIANKASTMSSGSMASFDFRANYTAASGELPAAYYTCVVRKYDNNSYVADIISNTGVDYKLSYAGNTWRLVSLSNKIPVFVSATATIGNISANSYVDATVDVSIPEGATGVKSIIPRYTSAGLPIAGAYVVSGAPSGKSRITVGVYNPKSSAVSNVTATIDVVFMY